MKRMYCYLTLIFTFLLGSYHGYIALWKEGEKEPLQVFPYSIHSLPPADLARLQNGIPLSSWEQLQMLIQDYLS